MKLAISLPLTILCAAGVSWAEVAVPQPPSHPLEKPLVWAMGKDPANNAQVEIDLLEEFARHGASGERSSKVFPAGMPASPADAIAQMHAQGCDGLVVVRRISTIRWDSDAKVSSLQSFLRQRSELLNPKNAMEAGNQAPIEVSNVSGNADWEINKGEAIVFDLSDEKMLWRSETQVKSAKDLPQARYYRLVAEKVAGQLAAAGFIPAKKK